MLRDEVAPRFLVGAASSGWQAAGGGARALRQGGEHLIGAAELVGQGEAVFPTGWCEGVHGGVGQ